MAVLVGLRLSDEEREPSLLPQCLTRTVTVRLLPNGSQDRKLHKLAKVTRALWNSINYERRQQFFHEKKVDMKGTCKKYYEKFKDTLHVNAQAVIQKNNEAWSSFFSLLKQGEKASPPGYWKDKEIIVVRQDRYLVKDNKLILKDFNMEIEFVGKLWWSGRQGRLEIVYDDVKKCWYAHIPIEVGVFTTQTDKPTPYIVHGERDKLVQKTPLGNKKASVDLGINILASVVVDDGTWLLYRGSRAKQDYFYFERKIAEVQSLADKTKNIGELEAYEELRLEKKRLFRKLYKRLEHLYRNLANHLAKTLHSLGVSEVYIGYPYEIAHDKGNKFTVNIWSYRKLFEILVMKLQEYGMKVYKVIEYNTSRLCAYHNVEVKRHPRGVVSCPKGHKLHSDLNGALNILKKAIKNKIPSVIKKPLSFFVEHNRVAPVKGSNTQDPSRNLAF